MNNWNFINENPYSVDMSTMKYIEDTPPGCIYVAHGFINKNGLIKKVLIAFRNTSDPYSDDELLIPTFYKELKND